jgi:hypothetical protein
MISGSLGHAQLGRFQLGGSKTSGIVISPAVIPSAASWGSPIITGGASGIIVPAALGPAQAWFNPGVVGPIYPTVIPSAAAWLVPVMNVEQVLAAAIIPSASDWLGGPRVANIIAIFPAVIPSAAAWPAPVVEGSPQWLNMIAGISSAQAWLTPAVSGGTDTGLQVLVGGVDVSEHVSRADGLLTIEAQTIGRWKCSIAFESYTGIPSWKPQRGQSLIVSDGNRRVFAGCVLSVAIDRRLSTTNYVQFRVVATDKGGILDRRLVTGKNYTSGTDIYQVVADINTNFLAGEGITLGGVPNDGSLGTLEADLTLNFVTVQNALDQIDQQAGTIHWVDPFGVLHISPLLALPAAPFDVVENGDGVSTLKWRNAQGSYGLLVTEDTTDYYNKLYAVSNLNIVPGASASGGSTGGGGTAGTGLTETFTWGVGNAGIISQPNGAGTLVPVGVQVGVPIYAVSSLTVNGVAQQPIDYGAYTGQTPPPPTWFYPGAATGNPSNQVMAGTLASPSIGDTIVVVYTPWIATGASVPGYTAPLKPSIPGVPLGSCGSGIFEGAIQVKDISLSADLDAIVAAELARIGNPPVIVQYETDWPGLEPGQLQNINVPLSGASSLKCMITQTSGVWIPPGPLNETGSSFRWQVTARTNLDPGNDVKWFERLVKRTTNSLPVQQSDMYTFSVPAGGGSLAAGAFGTPIGVKRSGRLWKLRFVAGTPAVDQDLHLFLQVDGSTVARIDVPAGTAANTMVLKVLGSGEALYLYQDQVLTAEAQYSVTGANPTRAGSLNFDALLAV